MRFLKNKKGFSFIELVVVMAVFAILGAAVSGLVKTGLNSYGNISSDMSSETEARTALSLVTVQIRQHDATGAITVNSDTSLTLSDPDMRIWFEDGYLWVLDLDDPDPLDKKIAEVTGFKIRQYTDSNETVFYEITVEYGPSGNSRELSQTITQRSAASA